VSTSIRVSKRKLASVWLQRKHATHYNSSSGMYVDLEGLLVVLRKKYHHAHAYVYTSPHYVKYLRLARDKQKPPHVLLSDRLPVAEAWSIFGSHARML
jgi:hypothetical protein